MSRLLRFLVATVVLLLFPAASRAAGVEVGIQHVIALPMGEEGFPGGVIEIEQGRGFGISGEWFVSERLSLRGAATFVNPAVILFPATPPPSDVDLGTLGLDIYSASARWHLAPRSRLSYYAGAGAAYVLMGNLEDRFGDDLEINLGPESALLAEGGLRYRFRERVFFELGVTWMPLESELDVVRADRWTVPLPVTIGIDPLVLSAGASWRF